MFQDLIGLEGDDLAQFLPSVAEKYAFLSCFSLWFSLCAVFRIATCHVRSGGTNWCIMGLSLLKYLKVLIS